MSLEAILSAIDASGVAEIAGQKADAEARAQFILAQAGNKAAAIQERCRAQALEPVAAERARRLHRAKLEAMQSAGRSRDQWMAAVLAGARRQLAVLRARPDYPRILREWVREAADALAGDRVGGGQWVFEVDPRDEALVRRIAGEFGYDAAIVPALDGWGGVVVKSPDGRVVVVNTVEARLARAMPRIQQELTRLLVQ